MSALHQKTALITGASAPNGIGAAIARRLAADGARVIVTDLGGETTIGARSVTRAELLQGLVDEIEAAGGQALAHEMDVTRPDSIQAAIAAALAQFQTLDIVVSNAGSLAGSDAFMTTTPAQWQSSFEVNLLGPMQLAQAAIPVMQAQGGGRIITIGSTGSLGAEPGFGAYTAMKHGLVGLTKTIAAEFGPDGILCNCVCPGYIATDMHEAANHRLAGEAGVSVDEIRTQRYAPVALRRAGMPQEVAEAVAYLAGPQASYVTGITLPVAGGVPCGI